MFTQGRLHYTQHVILRTPLQVIRVNAEALKLNPPDRDRFIDRILKELTHVSNLSEDLLTLIILSTNPASLTDSIGSIKIKTTRQTGGLHKG